MKIRPAAAINGTIDLPGDKSISHRSVMLASLADGTTNIANFAASADCLSTAACMRQLGAAIEQDGTQLRVMGRGLHGLSAPDAELDCGNSGTTMRLLAGILAGQNFGSVLTGDESLRQRPMKRVIEPLSRMGAMVESENGLAPLRITGRRPLSAGVHTPPVASAQLKSCILLAGLFADGPVTVVETVPTRDHTERMLRWFGGDVSEDETGQARRITINAAPLTARDLTVPSDISSAAFFMAAAAGLPGSEITLRNVGINPTRTAVIDILRSAGADIEVRDRRLSGSEPSGDIVVRGSSGTQPGALKISGSIVANVIDEIPILAVFGTRIAGGIEIRDAAELRVKESDRIRSVVDNLRRMGAAVEEFPDGLRVERSELKGAIIDSYGDHRIAMAFAVAGLFAKGGTVILGSECAAVSFPAFFDVLERVVS